LAQEQNMQPFTKHTGLVAPMDRVNVDTDQMVPKQFLKALTREGFGRTLFYDWRYLDDGKTSNPDFILNHPRYQGASILLARANFGCGSSREHAAWALEDYGFRAVIAPSFADIFRSNCTKIGLLPVQLTEQECAAIAEAGEAQVDLRAQEVRWPGGSGTFEIDWQIKHRLLNGLDDIAATLAEDSEAIDAYERESERSGPVTTAL